MWLRASALRQRLPWRVPAARAPTWPSCLTRAALGGPRRLQVRERLADAKVRIASDTFSRLQQQAAQHDSVSPFEDPANAHEGTRLRVIGKPSLSLKLPPAQKAYAQGTLDRGNMQCTNFTMLPGDRLYLPWGTVRAPHPAAAWATKGVLHGLASQHGANVCTARAVLGGDVVLGNACVRAGSWPMPVDVAQFMMSIG